MADFYIKQGDTQPDLVAILKDADGDAVDLSTATSVTFHMRMKNETDVLINRATIISPTVTGQVTLVWLATETETAGDFEAEFEVLWNTGKISTFPNKKHTSIQITEQIA